MTLLVGIDVGGTFTDAVAFDRATGRLATAKVRTTPRDHAEGFMAALREVVAAAGGTPTGVERIIHGTTVGTNAILERKGAPLGILTTAGFEDTLYIGRQKRAEMYDLGIGPETPGFFAPRHRIAGIRERVAPDGSVATPLDETEVVAAVNRLVEAGAQALAICYLFSYANPEHELRSLAALRRRHPDLPVSLSHQVDPRFREYERLCATAFDAYVRPVLARYLARLQALLREAGVRPALQLMHSRGGVTSADVLLDRPVGAILSGLAAGVLGGRHAAGLAGVRDGITLDVGGTSADVALFKDGAPLIASEGRVGKYALRLPMVDVETVGAGGGSIAYVDASGSLHVGPRSAGAAPGPACYGTGGDEPTVTDASLVLGYLNPAGLAGGRLPLDVGLAERAVRGRVADPLGLTTLRAAAGIHRVVNAVLADALRLVSVRRGFDPRDFTLISFGGAGPVHAGRLAAELDIPRVIVPPAPGVLSAFGLLVADVDHQEWGTLRARTDTLAPETLAGVLDRLASQCAERMRRDGVSPDDALIARVAEMRYVGQSYELQVPIDPGGVTTGTVDACRARFHETHARVYGQSDPGGAVELVGVRVQYRYPLPAPGAHQFSGGDGALPAERLAYFDEVGDVVATPVWPRSALRRGQVVDGPAIVDQADTTTVVYPGQRAELTEEGNLVLWIGQGSGPSRPPRASPLSS